MEDNKGNEEKIKPVTDLNLLDSKKAAEEGVKVELEHPLDPTLPFVDDAGKAYFIEILGADAAPVRARQRKQLDAYINAMRQNKNPGDAEKNERELYDRLAAATQSWYLPKLDGQELTCNEQNARKLYNDPRFPWIGEQLAKAIGDRARFFKKS